MKKRSALVGLRDNCEVCKTEPERQEELKDCVQELMDNDVLQFSRDRALGEFLITESIWIIYHKKQVEAPIKKIQSIVFHVPSPFPYQKSKVVPWKYNATVSVGGAEIQFPKTEIVNITGPRGMTRSGHVFTPKYTPIVVPAIVHSPQARASVCVPTSPAGAPDSTCKSTKATILHMN